MGRKKTKSRGNPDTGYKARLADRGLSRTPQMKWTGMTTAEITAAFAKLPKYRVTKDGNLEMLR